MIEEIILDTRELEAPEPIMTVLENLSSLKSNSYIKMIHRMEPKMLFSHLLEKNLKYKIIEEKENFYIYIWNQDFNKKDIKGL